VYAHVLEYVRACVIQVKEDVARVAAFGVRPEVDIKAQAMVCAQKMYHAVAGQLLCGPQTLSGSWFPFDGMDEADQIERIRHRRQLATYRLLGESFAVEHGAEHELGPRFSTMDFQSMVTSALTTCLTQGDKSTLWPKHSNAPHRDAENRRFRVTHPYHPLYQQEFEVVSYRQNWGEDRVWFQAKKDSRLHSLPMNWTDVGALDPFVAVAAGRSLFRVAELIELAKQVAGWKSEQAERTVKEKMS